MLRHPSSLRPAFRRAQLSHQVRWNSSSNSKQQLEAAQKKAQEVLASTQATAGKVFESAKKYAGPFGERVAGLLGSYQQPVIYNFSVAREVVKQIYHAENLRPPTSFSTIRSAYETMWANATSREFWRKAIESGDIAKLGIYAVEAYGIFKIGEILGRRSLVGYNLH